MNDKPKLSPIDGDILEVDPRTMTFKMRCCGKGDALWAQFHLLYPVIIVSRSLLGKVDNGANQDVFVKAVRLAGHEMADFIPSHLPAGKFAIVCQSAGASSIELELTARVDAAPADVGNTDGVADAIAALEAEVEAEVEAGRPEDPPPRPRPPAVGLLDAPIQTGGPFEAIVPPAIAQQVDRQFEEMMADPALDEATRRSITAFMEADGDPAKMDAPARRRRETEPA